MSIAVISKKITLLAVLLVCAITVLAGCTRMPVENRQSVSSRASVDSNKMRLVAQADIGTTTRYVDTVTGSALQISVLSEYFSASGRLCRRYTEGGANPVTSTGTAETVGVTRNGLACQDKKNGWTEIPIHLFAG